MTKKKSHNEKRIPVEHTKAKSQFTLLVFFLIIGIIGVTVVILIGTLFNDTSTDQRIRLWNIPNRA